MRKIGGENYRDLRGETERAKGEKERKSKLMRLYVAIENGDMTE